MALRTAPAHMTARLKAIDPRLEFRWSDQRGLWVIGRHDQYDELPPQMSFPGMPRQFKVMRILEGYKGERVELDDRVIEQTRRGDPWSRQYGMDDILDEIQAKNDAKERDDNRRLEDYAKDVSERALTRMKRLRGDCFIDYARIS